MERCVATKEGMRIESFDHLGDVLLALGKRQEAIEAWKTGIALAREERQDAKIKGDVVSKLRKLGSAP